MGGRLARAYYALRLARRDRRRPAHHLAAGNRGGRALVPRQPDEPRRRRHRLAGDRRGALLLRLLPRIRTGSNTMNIHDPNIATPKDTTGPYTDPEVTIDVEQGLARTRTAWVRERGGVEDYEGRPIQPVDNGNVSGKHRARNCPTAQRPLRAANGKPVTQLEWARAGVITKEMVYIAERENLGRKRQLERAEAALA